jgi:YD repeat-containing protein
VTDARGVRKEMFRDVRSQITTVNEFHNAAVFHTSYAYDPVRQITGVTDDQGNVTSVAYDLFGRRTAINSPDAGLTAFTPVFTGAGSTTSPTTSRQSRRRISPPYRRRRRHRGPALRPAR